MNDGMIRLSGMYEKTSAKTGNKYLTGRMNTGCTAASRKLPKCSSLVPPARVSHENFLVGQYLTRPPLQLLTRLVTVDS